MKILVLESLLNEEALTQVFSYEIVELLKTSFL